MNYKEKVDYNNPIVRTAFYIAYDRKDALNGIDITFREMQIDHIIPQTLFEEKNKEKLKEILGQHNLPSDFNKDCLLNLCPLIKETNGPSGKGSSTEYGILKYLLDKAKKKQKQINQLIEKSNQEINILQSASQIATQANDEDKEIAIDIILDDTEKFSCEEIFNDNKYDLSNEDIRIIGAFPNINNFFPITIIEFRKIKIRDVKIEVNLKDLLETFFFDAHSFSQRNFYKKTGNNYYINLKGFYLQVSEYTIKNMCHLIDKLYDEFVKRAEKLIINCNLMNFKFINNNSIEIIKISKKECKCIFNYIKNLAHSSMEWNKLGDSTDTIIKIKNSDQTSNTIYHAIIYAEQKKDYILYNMENDIALVQKIDNIKNFRESGIWEPLKIKQWLLNELFPKIFTSNILDNIIKNEEYTKKLIINSQNFIQHLSDLQEFYSITKYVFDNEISNKLLKAHKLLYDLIIVNKCKIDLNYIRGNLAMSGLSNSLNRNFHFGNSEKLNNNQVELIMRNFLEFTDYKNETKISLNDKLELYELLSDYIQLYNDHLILKFFTS